MWENVLQAWTRCYNVLQAWTNVIHNRCYKLGLNVLQVWTRTFSKIV